MAVAPLLMIGGSALAGYIGSKLGKKKGATTPQQATPQVEPPLADVPATPTPAPQAQSDATVTATQTAQRTRRRAAAGSSGPQRARTSGRRGAAQGTIQPAGNPVMLLGGGV